MIIDDKEPNCYNINVIWNVKIFLNSRKASLKVNDKIPAEKIWIYLIRALSEEGWRMSIVQPCTICRPFWKTKLGQGLYILKPFLGMTSLIPHHLNFSEKGKISAWCPWLVGWDGRGVGVATIPGESHPLLPTAWLGTTTSVECHRPQNANTNTNTNISTNKNTNKHKCNWK